MDGFTRFFGFFEFTTAAAEELPDAMAVVDPFHVVRLAGDVLDECRRQAQQETRGHQAPPAHSIVKR